MATTTRRPQRQRVTAYVTKKVTKNEVNDLLERIYKIAGCEGCGFNGFDVTFKEAVINPALNLGGAKAGNIAAVAIEEIGR